MKLKNIFPHKLEGIVSIKSRDFSMISHLSVSLIVPVLLTFFVSNSYIYFASYGLLAEHSGYDVCDRGIPSL